ncbi:hypothetical protein ALC62_13457, partial [Cyphomyrmex costatus]
AAFRFPTRVHPDTQKAFRFLLSAFIVHLGGTFRFLLYEGGKTTRLLEPGGLGHNDLVYTQPSNSDSLQNEVDLWNVYTGFALLR